MVGLRHTIMGIMQVVEIDLRRGTILSTAMGVIKGEVPCRHGSLCCVLSLRVPR